MLKVNGTMNVKRLSSPMNPNLDVYAQSVWLNERDAQRYHGIVGSSLYFDATTHQDISVTASIIVWYVAHATEINLRGTKHMLQYLNGTTKYKRN